jgi:hypothetical protein
MALERDLKDYLFDNPEILFPNQVIASKRKEVCIEGRFIDLLFEVERTQYIVELKRDTIRRETIGQIFEYYGLMRRSNKTANFKMILVAPSIPDFRRIPLEEFGIRCVEVPHPSESPQEQKELTRRSAAQLKRAHTDGLSRGPMVIPSRADLEDLLPPASLKSWKISQLLLRDGLQSIEKEFSEYEIRPVKMANSSSQDILCFPSEGGAEARFVRGGAWWAFSFGHIEQLPKNDVPNISVNTLPWGLDFAVNAELRSSQEVMLRKIENATSLFDELVAEHGNLRLQAWLKLEHQPRFYHWIPLVQKPQGSWRGGDIVDLYRGSEVEFTSIRRRWVGWIKEQRKELTSRQSGQIERRNQRLNLALRLVHSFPKDDLVWSVPYQEQTERFNAAYKKLKPLIEFFQ